MQSEARRDKINSVLLNTKANDRSHADVLQAELTRRDTALFAAHADNDRLRESFSEQMETKSSLRFELQVCPFRIQIPHL